MWFWENIWSSEWNIDQQKLEAKEILKNLSSKWKDVLDSQLDKSDFLTESEQEFINDLKNEWEKLWKSYLKNISLDNVSISILNMLIDDLPSETVKKLLEIKQERENRQLAVKAIEDKDNINKGSVESQWEVITKYHTTFLWIPVDFISPEVNEYLKDPEIIRLLKILSVDELSSLVWEINTLYWDDHKFKDYESFGWLKDILAKKWYKADWIMLWSDAAIIVESLKNYLKMQSEIIPNLNDELIVKMLIDSDKDWKLSKETISNYWTEFDTYLSILRNRLNKWNAKNFINNLWFWEIENLREDMSKNLYSTRENFQRTLRSLKDTWFNLTELFNKDFIKNKVNKQIQQVKESKEKVPEELKTWLLNWIVSKQSIPTLIPSSREELNDSWKNLYDKMLDYFSPSFLWIDFWWWGGPWISASFPIPKLPETAQWYEDFFNLITPDSFSISTWFDWNLPSFSINKNILPSFLNKYWAYVTFTLVNWFMPVISWGKNFEMKDMWEMEELFQEKAKREWIDSNVHFSLNPLWRTIDVWITFSRVDENTQAWIERMTNKTWELLKDIWVKILNWEKSYWLDNALYNTMKNTFDNITQWFSSQDKILYMNNIFLRWYLKAYKDFLYNAAEWFDFTSVWVGFSNSFTDDITEEMKNFVYETAWNTLSQKTWGKINDKQYVKTIVKDTWNYWKLDKIMDRNIEKVNKKTYWLSNLFLKWYINPIPYITLWWEYKRTKMIPQKNHEIQRLNKEQKNLENIWNNWDVKIEEKEGRELLSINSNLVDNISSKSWKVELKKEWNRVYLWWIDLSKLEFYNKVDDWKNEVHILIDWWRKNKEWNFEKAEEINLSNPITYNNPSINISSSSTWYSQENKTIHLWATVKWPELQDVVKNFAEKEINKAIWKVLNKYITKFNNNWVNLDILSNTINSYISNRDTINHIRNIMSWKDWIQIKEDFESIRSLLVDVSNISSTQDLSKINYRWLIRDFKLPIENWKIETAEKLVNIIETVIKSDLDIKQFENDFNNAKWSIQTEFDRRKPEIQGFINSWKSRISWVLDTLRSSDRLSIVRDSKYILDNLSRNWLNIKSYQTIEEVVSWINNLNIIKLWDLRKKSETNLDLNDKVLINIVNTVDPKNVLPDNTNISDIIWILW